MSETIPLERMRPDEIARLKIRYTNRDGSAEVLCSKAWAHIQLQDATIASLRAEVARKDAALTLAVASDGGIAYSSEDDAVGYRVCCGGSSFNPHDDDCWVTVSRAALNPSQEPRT
jgi:hypothetical protein